MDVKLYSKDPRILITEMESYFKSNPPDCNLYSGDNYVKPVHKEIFYQTQFMRDMVKSVEPDSSVDIICHSVSKEELDVIVDFLYNGTIFGKNEIDVYQSSMKLHKLFGFPIMQCQEPETHDYKIQQIANSPIEFKGYAMLLHTISGP